MVCHVIRSVGRVLICDAADSASLATRVLFGKLIGVAITFGFGEKRCRKNLPLGDLPNLMYELPRDRIIGSRLLEIGHSAYSDPEFVLQGIGPARFRSHYLRLDSGLVLDLFVADVILSDVSSFPMQGETSGLDAASFIGRQITSVLNDDSESPIILFDDGTYFRDANDGCYGNPLHAGYVDADYNAEQRTDFSDFWSADDGPVA